MPATGEPTIRKATVEDTPELIDMIHALDRHHGDRADACEGTLMRDVFESPPWVHILIAESGDEAIGYVALYPVARLHFGLRGMEIHHIFVREGQRGEGVGRALIEGSIGLATEFGCASLSIGAQDANVSAHDAYLAWGFTRMPPPGPRFRRALQRGAPSEPVD